MKNRILIIFSIILFSCTTAKLTTPTGPTQADADRGAALFPGYTLADLTEGKRIHDQYCGNCHGFKDPTSESAEKWKEIVPRMVKKVNKKEGKTAIDGQMEELVLRYVITMGDKSKQVH